MSTLTKGGLCLSRRKGEVVSLTVGEQTITITVNNIRRGKVSLGVIAPREIKILRGELLDREGAA